MAFGKIQNGYLRSSQVQIPWLPSEVSVKLSRLAIPGLGDVALDYKNANFTENGGLYVYCNTNGANGASDLVNQVVECTFTITKK